jgi:hypothetical protein
MNLMTILRILKEEEKLELQNVVDQFDELLEDELESGNISECLEYFIEHRILETLA